MACSLDHAHACRMPALDTARFEQRQIALERARRASCADLARLLDISERITASLDNSMAIADRSSDVRKYHARAMRACDEIVEERRRVAEREADASRAGSGTATQVRAVRRRDATDPAQGSTTSPHGRLLFAQHGHLAAAITDAQNKLEFLENYAREETGQREVLLAARARLRAAYAQAQANVDQCDQLVNEAVLDLVLEWADWRAAWRAGEHSRGGLE